MTKITKKVFKIAIKGSGGIQSIVAKVLHVERSTVSQWLNRHPDMKELLEKEREKIIDKAESKLFIAADNGEKWAIERILRTIGKNRGYGDYQQLEHSGNIDKLTLEIIDGQDDSRPTNKSPKKK